MELGHLLEQFPCALVAGFGCFDGNFHNLIATLVGPRVEDSLFTQPEALAVLSALRNFEQGAAVDGRHFDLGSERGFPDGNGHLDLDIVAFAMKERVLFHFGGDVEIAWRRAHGAGIALAGNTEPGTVARSRRDSDLDCFRPRDTPIAATGGTGI